jgi:hypothetical protein
MYQVTFFIATSSCELHKFAAREQHMVVNERVVDMQ